MMAKWIKRGLAAIVVLVLVFGAVGAWLAPSYIKRTVEGIAGQELGRAVSVGAITINPYTLQFQIDGIAIKAQDGGPFFSVERINAGASWYSVFRLVPVIDHLSLTSPKISIARLEANRYSFSDIVERLMAKPKPEKSTSVAFVLNQIAIEGGTIDFDDQPEKTRHEIRNLRFNVPFLSSVPRDAGVAVQPVLTALVNGMAMDLSGKLTPFADPLGASLKLDFKDLDITRYVEYVPFPLGFKLASGTLAGEINVDLSNTKAKGTSLSARGQIALANLDLREKSNAPMLELTKLDLDVGAVDPFEREVTLKSLAIDGFNLKVRRHAGGLNLDALKPPASAGKAETGAAPAKEAAPPKAMKFALAELSVSNSRIEFVDEVVTPRFQTSIEKLALSVKNLSSEPGSKAESELAFNTRAGETLQLNATIGLAPLAVESSVKLDKVGLAPYAPYLSPYLDAVVEGTVSASASVRVAEAESVAAKKGEGAVAPAPRINVDNLGVQLAGLKLSRGGAQQLALAESELKVAAIDVAKRSVSGAEVTARNGRLALKRGPQGELSVMQWLQQGGDAKAATPPVAAEKTEPWTVDLKRAALEGFALDFEDATTTPAVRMEINPIALLLEGFSTRPGAQAKLTAKMGVNKAGSLELAGPLVVSPLSAKLAVKAGNLGIVPLQPYFSRFINALVTSGAASANGDLQVQTVGGETAITFAGGAGVTGFTLMDAAASQPLINFKALNFEQAQVQTLPLSVNVGKIALSDFFTRLVVLPDGRLNLQNISVTAADAAADKAGAVKAATNASAKAADSGRPADAAKLAADAKAAAAPVPAKGQPIRIAQVTLQGGTVEFSDQQIRPNFSARLSDIGGNVSGLSGEPGTRAKVELKGNVGGAPLDIGGTINPLAGALFLDIKASAKGIDLNPMTPYAAKYVGYGIERGKLSVDLGYKIENGKIDAQNRIFLDQLTFGERVESPDAIKLPVLLAVALLKNSRGEIDINLPVAGSLEDPEFSVGGIVFKLIVNLLVKAVTAPFALLGSLFGGGGEELSYVEFDAGLDAVVSAQESKLRNLAKALADRSGLRLEIAGRTDAASDREGLKRETLRQKVRAQKVAGTVVQGSEVNAAGEVQVTAAEYPELLKRAYDRETFAKPRNAIGMVRPLPVEEMEKLILTHIEAGDQLLRDLARRRADAVRAWLIKEGGVAVERIFLVEPRAEEGDKESRAKARGSRVDLYIK